jgi:hypothetical protein
MNLEALERIGRLTATNWDPSRGREGGIKEGRTMGGGILLGFNHVSCLFQIKVLVFGGGASIWHRVYHLHGVTYVKSTRRDKGGSRQCE